LLKDTSAVNLKGRYNQKNGKTKKLGDKERSRNICKKEEKTELSFDSQK